MNQAKKDIHKLMNFHNPFRRTSPLFFEAKKPPMDFEGVYQENVKLRAAFDKLSEDYYRNFREHHLVGLNKRLYKSDYETDDTENKSYIRRRSERKQKSVEIQTAQEEPKEPPQPPVTVINNLANPMESALQSLGK